jgi:hypothetical protein
LKQVWLCGRLRGENIRQREKRISAHSFILPSYKERIRTDCCRRRAC